MVVPDTANEVTNQSHNTAWALEKLQGLRAHDHLSHFTNSLKSMLSDRESSLPPASY